MSLVVYKQKRNFGNTPEPAGAKATRSNKLRFVIQRHAASHLHYDFRLEIEGVLKSWAVPKGPSMKAGERRLAVMVEDHPMEYGKFFGVIPKGNYGAGVVDIWDEGTYEPLEETKKGQEEKSLLMQLKKGDLKIVLHGKHLKGAFALVRMNDGQDKNWLLIKKKDAFTEIHYNIEKVKPLSLGSSAKNTWTSNGSGYEEKVTLTRKTAGIKEKKPAGVSIELAWKKLQKPMLAKLSDEVVDNAGWIYEMKYDGYRALAKISKGKAELFSRNGNSFNKAYPSLIKELQKIKKDVILDGEIVIEDKKGISNFQLLQNYSTTKKGILKFYVFDILFFDGYNITSMPLIQRKELLQAFFEKYTFANIHESPYVAEKGTALFKKYSVKGYEGIIAKDGSSTYMVGKRTDAWLKIKTTHVQEAVICGYTQPQNSRQHFGSLILGLHEKGKLRYIGNCGTGFTDASLKELHAKLAKLETVKSPFAGKISRNAQRGKPVWLKPTLVCNVKFQEWTNEGHMRIPVFMGLRTDKKAKGIVREEKIKGMSAGGSKKQHTVKAENKETGKVKSRKKKTVTKPFKTAAAGSNKQTRSAGNEESQFLKIGKHEVKITNTAKLYWPKEGVTKGDLIGYYARMAKYMLPYLKDRPQSLNRHPNGIAGPGFYQKDMDVKQVPSWIHTQKMYSKHNKGYIDYLICNDAETLVYMANLGCIEINPWHSRYTKPDHPDYMMLDLDPGNIGFVDVVNTALIIKEICDEINVPCYCKTSGATGLHIYIPLGAKYTYDEVKLFAQWMANRAHERLPDTTSVERMTSKRRNKIYLDFLQNSKGQTIASVYSVRPRDGATVSTPLEWKEVNHKLDPKQFTIHNIEKRITKKGDLWKGVLGKPIDLNKVLNEIDQL
ncbi:MAG TPA: DNA ligase D [Flavobacteriales bacterium]|nr:DNA ligase D [Flavobacteriales bacterium]